MNRILLGVAVVLLSTAANAQIYQWKDDSGKTVISDKPPAGAARQQRQIDSGTPGSDSAPQKTLADRELEFRKRQKYAQENAEKTRKEQTQVAARKENCSAARRQLQLLESGERIAMRDDKGERYYLDDAARQQEIQKARQVAAASCD